MKREAVSLLGLAAFASSFLLPHFTVKPNRVAEGVPQRVWVLTQAQPVLVALLVVLVAFSAAVVLIAVRSGRDRLVARALAAALAFPALVALLGAGGSAALELAGHEAGRVGPALGWWLAAVGAYVLFYDARRRVIARGGVSARRRLALVSSTAAAAVIAVVVIVPVDSLGLVQEYANRTARFWAEAGSHLVLSGASVAGAVVIGVPLGMLAFRSKRAVQPVFTVTSGLQTIPSLALFGLMIAPLAFLSRQVPVLRELGIRGVGNAPAIIALTLYGLLPIVRNTFVGLKSIDRGVLDAGKGMGMSRSQLLAMVQIPIALPIILTGLRITAVQTVGNAAVAALIGARGLGNFVFQGLGQAAPDLIVLGALPIVVLAVAVDRVMDALITALRPGGKEDSQ